MGVVTWKKEFYKPIHRAQKWTDKECFEHTRTKYTGVLKENLSKHDVVMVGNSVEGMSERGKTTFFTFDDTTCSLCKKYEDCSVCPLGVSGNGCDKLRSPYRKCCFSKRSNPVPMIETMDKLISQCDEDGNWVNPKEY